MSFTRMYIEFTRTLTRMVFGLPSFILLLLIVLLPAYGPMMTYWEGSILPVTSHITIVSQTPSKGGLDITFSYNKYRFCEVQGLVAKAGAIDVNMGLADGSPAPIRQPGFQVSRPWHVDATSLDGLKIWFIHRCSFLWLTATQVYP